MRFLRQGKNWHARLIPWPDCALEVHDKDLWRHINTLEEVRFATLFCSPKARLYHFGGFFKWRNTQIIFVPLRALQPYQSLFGIVKGVFTRYVETPRYISPVEHAV